jgi:hypothetical protein
MKRRKLLSAFVFFGLLLVQFTRPVTAITPPQAKKPLQNGRCEWTIIDGHVGYCAGGFKSPEDLKQASIDFWCGGSNCGGIIERARLSLTGSTVQSIKLGGLNNGNPNIAQDGNGYYTCFYGNFDQGVNNAITEHVRAVNAACILPGATIGIFAGSFATPIISPLGGAAVGIGVGEGTYTACNSLLSQYNLTIYGSLKDGGQSGTSCEDDLQVSLSAIEKSDKGELTTCSSDSNVGGTSCSAYNLCNQIPDHTERNKCLECAGSFDSDKVEGVWTALGCIKTDQQSVIGAIMKLGLGIAGGFALLLIIAAGFMLTTSTGDAKKAGEAKELLTSAVIGLLFLIFSVTILQFIGVKIFRIPGFGEPTNFVEKAKPGS